jgi:glycyl-tRNA synthetase beta chain
MRLAEAHVYVNHQTRRDLVVSEIGRVISESSSDLVAVMDEELVAEVTNLIEEPTAILGRFDSQFLELPPAVSSTAMKEHQRYFPVTDSQGRQAPYFVAVNNTKARDMDVVRRGHERVLRARLEDARFYYEEDRKTKLSDRSDDLEHVIFHHHLGSYREKIERVSKLALALSGEIAPTQKEIVQRAALLCKCDLVTGVVKEFPSLQGVMGREYALADGEPPEVAEAISGHYLPIKAGGALPPTLSGAILSVADKLDTICGCFGVGISPTGTADPLALRRQALGIILIFLDRGWNLSIEPHVDRALLTLGPLLRVPAKEAKTKILDFFTTRLKSHLLSLEISADAAEAVISLHGTYPLPSVQRSLALEGLKKREGFRDLAQTFKRVVNIIKKFGGKEVPLIAEVLEEEAEKKLLERVMELETEAGKYLASGDFKELLERIADLKAPVDDFFDKVLVDAPNQDLKNARIALLFKTSGIFELIADFSRISTV